MQMKRKTLRERQQTKAAREAKKIERQKVKAAQNEWDSDPEHMADAHLDSFEDEEQEADLPLREDKEDSAQENLQAAEADELNRTFAAMEGIAEKFGIEPNVSTEDELQMPFAPEAAETEEETSVDAVELSAFDHFRKKQNSSGYQSRDNGRLFKLYNLNLLLRIVLFFVVLFFAVKEHDAMIAAVYAKPWEGFNWLMVLWVCFILTILARFIPGLVKNPGYQKQFTRYFAASPNFDEENIRIKRTVKRANRGAWKVLGVWAGVNLIIGILYLNGIFDETVMILLALLYSVADVVCILYYCPFQHLLMKNRCCMTCRIYNWDFMMMCTPLIFIKSWLTWSLVAVALLVLIRWEYVYKHHPERFFGATNGKLRCVNCTSKLCRAKTPATPTAKQLFDRK